MKKEITIWRKATEEEIEKGLDSKENPKMFLVGTEMDEVLDVEPEEKPSIKEILSATPEELEALKAKLGIN